MSWSAELHAECPTTHVLWLLLLLLFLLSRLLAALLGLLLLLLLSVSTGISTCTHTFQPPSHIRVSSDGRPSPQTQMSAPGLPRAQALSLPTHVGTKKEAREEKNPPADPLCSPVNVISVDMLEVLMNYARR